MIHPFECVLVGHGTLPLACAEVLLERGNRIRAVISSDPALLRWAAVREIAHSADLHALAGLLAGLSPDFLFSIGNERLIPDPLLALCKSAINYHDGPLPLYAGSHVTSWALIQREQTYAVTWHLMTHHTDAGDILRQTPVRISSDDSALTLNAKCYEAALSGFALLADDLANDRVQLHAQDLSRRTFFHRNKRPVSGAVLDWSRDAEDLCALVRALAFGSYANPLGFPKVLFGEEFLAVDTLDMLSVRSAHPPGTIAGIEPDSLVISTASCDVGLRQVKTLAGQALSIGQLVTRFHLQIGDVLPTLDPLTAARLDEATNSLSGHERFWLGRLTAARAIGLPYSTSAATCSSASADLKAVAPRHHTLALPPELAAVVADRDDRPADLLLYVFLAYLARINGQSAFSIGLREADLASELGELSSLFATTVPLQVSLDLNGPFNLCADASRSELSLLRSRRTYALDTMARHPGLDISGRARGTPAWLIVAQIMDPHQDLTAIVRDGLTEKTAPSPHELVFRIAADGLSCAWTDGAGALTPRQLEQMSGQYLTLLQSSLTMPGLPLRSLPLLSQEERRNLRAVDEPVDASGAMSRPDGL